MEVLTTNQFFYTRTALSLCALIGLLLPSRFASAQAHQITPWRHNHAGAVTLSFDDGNASQIANAVPLLNARGQKATFFITTTGMDATWDQWRQVAAQGHEIASHTVNHLELTTLSDSALRFELSESQRAIRQNIPSQSCITLAYPLNTTDARVQAVTSEYYIAARGGYVLEDGGDFNFYEDIPEFDPPPGMSIGSFKAMHFYNVASDNGLYDVPTSSLDLKLDVAVTYHAWYNTYLHFIPDDTTLLAAFLDHVAARDLWMATFGDVAKYMRERKSSTLSVLSSTTSAIQLQLANALDGSVYNAPLTIRSVVPSTWLTVNIAQGASSIFVDSVVEGADRVVYFDAVPNQGTITLSSEPPTLTTIGVSPSPASVVAGSTQQFTATAKDQFGNDLAPQPVFTWTVSGGGTVDANGLFTADSTAGGTFTVTATSGSVSGTASVTVTAPPTLTTISVSPSPASVGARGAQQFTATAKDQFGSDLVPQPGFSWAVDGGGTIDAGGLFTAGSTEGGPFTVTASSGSVSGTASVTVTAPPVLTSISVSPSAASVGVGSAQQFVATARDQFGNALVPQPIVSWAVSGGGTINSSGLFTAGSAPGGPFTVTATSGSVSGSANAMVTQTLTSISVSPSSASVPAGSTQQFTAAAMDQLGNPMVPQPAFTWTVSGGGTISSGGLFTAGSTTGGPFTVRASSGSVSGTASVTVTYAPAITVTAPNTAVSWRVTTKQNINFTHNLGVGQVLNIEVSRDGGSSWNAITTFTTTSATAGTYSWTVSGPPTTQARIRVSSAANPQVTDSSDVNFTIVNPVITVTAPNTAVNWRAGDTKNVTFSHSMGVGQTVNIDVSRDGGATWGSVATFTTTSATSGTYPWIVSGPPTTQARIRVSWTVDPSVTDLSDVNFTILPRVTVTAPNTAVTWGAGSTRKITWTHNLGVGGTVNIEFSPDNGATWTPVASGVASDTATTGAYIGPMPATVTTQGLIRVSPTIDPTTGDVSNVSFTLATPKVTVTAPNTAVNWAIGATKQIKWSHNLGTLESVTIELARDGVNYSETIAAAAVNTGGTSSTFNWIVTGPATTTARIRVTWPRDAAVTDISNVNFKIQ